MEKKKTGRPPSGYPEFLKKFRATEEEQAEFLKMLPGDARDDFLRLFNLLLDAKEAEQDKEFFEKKE